MTEKKCLIVETLNPISVLEKSETNGLVRVSGCFGVCGVVNDNGRTYNKANYAEQIKKLQERITTEGLLGELEHPNSMNINLENVSHKIESIEMRENGEVWGTICLANTPKGKIAQAIVEMGTPLFISSRAKGRIDERGNVTLEELKTYDLVGTPGFSQAILRKDQTYESLNESLSIIIENTNENNLNNQMNDQNVTITKEAYDSITGTISSLTEKLSNLEKNHETLIEKISNYFSEEVLTELNNIKKSTVGEVKEWCTEEFAPLIEGWITEEYSPMVQNWITEEYSPMVQNWITEEYSPMLQNWITEEYSPMVQNWVTEEFANEVSNWTEKEVVPEIYVKVQEKLDESLKTNNSTKMNSIDETLKLLESLAANPNNQNININENKSDDIYESLEVVKSMPVKYRTLWNASTTDIKKSILERAKVYNFTSQEVVERFWSNIDFAKVAIDNKQIVENASEYEINLRENIRKYRKY